MAEYYSIVPQRKIDPDEQWREARLRRVRDFIKQHLPSARRFVAADGKKLTKKQYSRSDLLCHTNLEGKREYIIPDDVFRNKVCARMPWRRVLHTLMVNHFLNWGPGLIAKDLVEPFGRVSVVSIKPRILKYRTEAETRADQEQAEDNVRRVRDYLAQYEKMARSSAMEYAQRLTRLQLSEMPLLAHVRRRKLSEFILSRRQFRREFSSKAISANAVLKHLRAAGLLNATDDGELYVWRKFARPLRMARVVSIKLAIREYTTVAEEEEEQEREERRSRRLAQRRSRRFRSGGGSSQYKVVPLFGVRDRDG